MGVVAEVVVKQEVDVGTAAPITPLGGMMAKHGESVAGVFPQYHEMRKFYPQSVPSSLWMRVKA